MLVALVVGTAATAWAIAARELVVAADVYLPAPSIVVGHGPGADTPSPQSLVEDSALTADVVTRLGLRTSPRELGERLTVRWDSDSRIAIVRLRGLSDADGRRAAATLAQRLVQRWTSSIAVAREYQARVKNARDRIDTLMVQIGREGRPGSTRRLEALARLESALVALNDRLERFGVRTDQRPRVARPPYTEARGVGGALAAGVVAGLVAALITIAALALQPRASRRRSAVA